MSILSEGVATGRGDRSGVIVPPNTGEVTLTERLICSERCHVLGNYPCPPLKGTIVPPTQRKATLETVSPELSAIQAMHTDLQERVDRVYQTHKEIRDQYKDLVGQISFLALVVSAIADVLGVPEPDEDNTVTVDETVREQIARLIEGVRSIGAQQQWVTDRTSEAYEAFGQMVANGGMGKMLMSLVTGKNPMQNLMLGNKVNPPAPHQVAQNQEANNG